MRTATIERNTHETQITLTLNLDGQGQATLKTGVGFLEHMLNALARHARFDLEVKATGDLYIDEHHTVEDVGLVLGQAFGKALGDKAGITRMGHAIVPMDEALALVAVDTVATPFYAVPVAYRSTSSFADDPKGLEKAAFFVLVYPGWTLYLGYGGSSKRSMGEDKLWLKKMDARRAAKAKAAAAKKP